MVTIRKQAGTLVAALSLAATGAFAVAGAPAAGAHEASTQTSAPMTHEARTGVNALRRAFGQYRDPAAAIADGYLPSDVCAELPGVGGMGYHYVNPAQAVLPIDPLKPAILVYVPHGNDSLRLGAVEWLQPDADGDLATDEDRPSVFGIPFEGPMPGHDPSMPVHYDLHAWVFTPNPDGMFAAFNPRVTCPAP